MSPLKYLFTAVFEDGSFIMQNSEDRSEIDPEKRSTFYDVLQKAETTPIKTFELIDVPGGNHRYSVHLDDGHFEINGVSFKMHEEELSDFRLIFFRHHTHSFNQYRDELSHEIVYRFGWQTTKDGENYQRVMQIQ